MKKLPSLLLVLALTPYLLAASLADLRPKPNLVPEPSAGQGCPVPPIPSGDEYFKAMRAEGWSLDLGKLWREWVINGRRYSVEYGIRDHDGMSLVPTVFPQRYSFDFNRDGIFEIPGEVFLDTKGDGRCADLTPVQAANPDKPA